MVALGSLLLLAVLQGLTEFLPISSSGHLVIAKSLLNLDAPCLRLEVILHFGTMFSIMAYYRRELSHLITTALHGESASWQMIGYIAISSLPAILFYFTLRHPIESLYQSPKAVGALLLVTGMVLLALRWLRHQPHLPLTARRALLIGCAQALAILPGISRSGSTIATARALRIAPRQAAQFSFLMSLPLLAGAVFLECLKMATESAPATHPYWQLFIGALVACAVGYLALAFLIRLLSSGKFWLFGIYCLVIGTITLIWA